MDDVAEAVKVVNKIVANKNLVDFDVVFTVRAFLILVRSFALVSNDIAAYVLYRWP